MTLSEIEDIAFSQFNVAKAIKEYDPQKTIILLEGLGEDLLKKFSGPIRI